MGGLQLKVIEHAGLPEPGWFMHDERFGVEIELEHVEVPDRAMRSGWRFVTDGSLRDMGMEFLTAPVSRAEFEPMAAHLYMLKDELGWQANARTGTHVHYNCLGMELGQVYNILALYILLEPLLFRAVGQEREENIYCVPWYRAHDEIRKAALFADDNFHDPTVSACKYSALYLEPLSRFGTLEFRHAPVFDTPAELLRWMDIIRYTCTAGVNNSVESLVSEYYEHGVDRLIRRNFPRDISRYLQGLCSGTTPQAVVDEHDTISLVESLAPCTYNVEPPWEAPTLDIEGSPEGYSTINRFHRGEAPYLRDRDGEFDDEIEE